MGLGIGYVVTLRKLGDAGAFLQAAVGEAKARGWKSRRRAKDSLAASFSPHPKSEDLTLDFSDGPVIDEYLKTSFAPEAVHIAVVEFFDALKPHCKSLKLDDETGYAKHRDLKKLGKALGSLGKAMESVNNDNAPSFEFKSFEVFDDGTMAPMDLETGATRMSELQRVDGKPIKGAKKATRRKRK